MKRVLCLSLLLGAICLSSSTFAQKKIGHINLDSLLKAMPQSDSARKVGQNYYQQLSSTIQSMQDELQKKYKEYQDNQAIYTELVKQTKQQELQDLNQRIQNFQQQAQTSLQKFNDSITRPIITLAKNAIKAVATEKGYEYILDTSTGVVLYFENSDDVFALVADKLGLKAKSSAPSKGK
ncbi:MAG: OmpH family outer membrane protein [Bacteroidia bacterium]|nr:OmpH family outer membrane protein [Bacteroidia bacterium]